MRWFAPSVLSAHLLGVMLAQAGYYGLDSHDEELGALLFCAVATLCALPMAFVRKGGLAQKLTLATFLVAGAPGLFCLFLGLFNVFFRLFA
ncbi:MAG: hypothetical protein ACOZIN_04610 [Myxococcota bacterium]